MYTVEQVEKEIGVLTGDIVQSRAVEAVRWQHALTRVLSHYGKEPGDWEFYRGDSFQLQLPAANALKAALHIKAAIRQLSPLDVRIGIGLGEATAKTERVTQASGPAFVRSGTCFDQLGKNRLAIRTGKAEADETLNLLFALAQLSMNEWTETVALVICTTMEHPQWTQSEVAQQLNRSQSTVSEALKRGGFDEIQRLEFYYRQTLNLPIRA